ncbi:MAG: nitroreductase family protein [Microthrixaceae bacterium]
MELYDGIMTTRAMRRLASDPVPTEQIEAILRAAQQGPSGGNIQPWQFVVATDSEDRAWMGECYRSCYDRYERALLAMVPPQSDEASQASWDRTIAASRHLAEHLAEVPVHVLVCMPEIDLTLADDDGPMDIGTTAASVYPAVQNLVLAARGFGLGSVVTTVFRIRHADVCEYFGVPEGWSIAALVPIGRPLGRFGVAPRKPVHKVTHWGRWGERRSFETPGYIAPEGVEQ